MTATEALTLFPDKSEQNHDTLNIRLFGDLVLTYDQQILSGEKVRAKQVWTLLQYLLLHRNKEVSAERLIEILWEDEALDDPANALKNLAYRLRNTLKTYLGQGCEKYITYTHGSYAWNNALPCQVDTDLFEQKIVQARNPNRDPKTKRALLSDAIALYNGELLPQASYRQWVIAPSVYYNRLFMEACETLSIDYISDGNYAAAEEICLKAIGVDYFNERNHELLLEALLLSNNHKQIKNHYQVLSQRFYDELGLRPSATIIEIYNTSLNHEMAFEKDIVVVKTDLKESIERWGAITCNYEVFKHIYHLQARSALRNGKPVFIALLTIALSNNQQLNSDALEALQEELIQSLASSLRKDDVVARYNRTQYLIMLSNITQENTHMVIQRATERCKTIKSLRNHKFNYQIQSLDPIELERD